MTDDEISSTADPRDWDNAERRGRDPTRADIIYDGQDQS